MIRTFLAVDFDDAFLDEVAALADRLRAGPRLSAARWAARETLHTTLRYFGDTDDRQLVAMRALVHELATGVTSLPVRAQARAVSLGFAAESRPYHAHLTLARMRKAVDVTSLAVEAASLGAGQATAITLYASSSSPNGAVYTPLERVRFA
jgi:2'-5' RNA ligase